MNHTIQTQLAHRTIRRWQDREVPEEWVAQLLAVGQRAPSSTGMQCSSIIRITDAALKEKLAELSGQAYTVAPVLMVLVLDMYRNGEIAREKGEVFTGASDYYSFQQAMLDVGIMAQNMVVAAESLGLGTVYFGSLVMKAKALAELLHLPERTLPVVGLGIGFPAVEPQLKPRLPLASQVFDNEYRREDSYLKALAEYDAVMQEYYDTRDMNRRVDSFTTQVARRYGGATLPAGQELFSLVTEQGFTWVENGKEQ